MCVGVFLRGALLDEVVLHLFAEREKFNGHLKDDKTKQLQLVRYVIVKEPCI